jgi:hypothetical protein
MMSASQELNGTMLCEGVSARLTIIPACGGRESSSPSNINAGLWFRPALLVSTFSRLCRSNRRSGHGAIRLTTRSVIFAALVAHLRLDRIRAAERFRIRAIFDLGNLPDPPAWELFSSDFADPRRKISPPQTSASPMTISATPRACILRPPKRK